MRVTHVITRLIIGGAQENTIATVFGLHGKSDVQVHLVAGPTTGPEGSLESRFDQAPQLLTIIPSLVRPIHPFRDGLALWRLTRVFRQSSPDLVHTHSGKAGILGRLAAHRAQVPVIVHTIHGPSFGPFQRALANSAFRAAERYAGRFTSHFVVVAKAMAEQYLTAGIGLPDQYTRIFSGFRLEPFLTAQNDRAFRAHLGLAADDLVVGKIARLFKLKGHDDLIDVATELTRQCPRMKFLLVGDGVWRNRLEHRVRERGLRDRFVFAGLVPPEAIPRYLGVMDVLVHLSRREGLARALPQALAASRPIVAYDCDGASEVCLDGETGFLVRPGDLAELSGCLLRLANDAALRERLGRRGRQFVQDHFPVERMVNELLALYARLLKTSSTARGAQRASALA